MVKVKKDLTGMTFGRLTVVHQADDYVAPNGIHYAQWECECSCGNKNIIVSANHLKSGKIQSCGCLSKDVKVERLKKLNKYDLSGKCGVGFTSNTNKEFYFDFEDYDKIKDYCWRECTGNSGQYHFVGTSVKINNKRTTIPIHKLILQEDLVDHIDRDAFNNKKDNLRPATAQQNATNKSIMSTNKSGFVGVRWNNEIDKWVANICVDYKSQYLGSFDCISDAIVARLQAELKYFGKDFAPQRHLFAEYEITDVN